jgi:hypothetical protein
LLQCQEGSVGRTSFKKTVLGAVTKPLLYLVGWLAREWCRRTHPRSRTVGSCQDWTIRPLSPALLVVCLITLGKTWHLSQCNCKGSEPEWVTFGQLPSHPMTAVCTPKQGTMEGASASSPRSSQLPTSPIRILVWNFSAGRSGKFQAASPFLPHGPEDINVRCRPPPRSSFHLPKVYFPS